MKKFILPAAVLVFQVIITSCIKDVFCINGNGIMETQSRSATSFDHAVNTTVADVIYKKADSVSISLTAESNIINHIVAITDNGMLEIRTDPRNACFDYTQKPVVIITSPELNSMDLTGSGDFSADSLSGNSVTVRLTGSGNLLAKYITSTELTVKNTGSGNMKINNDVSENSDFTVTGSGYIEIEGVSNTGVMRVTGSGDIKSGGFNLQSATETITGSGNIYTLVQNSLKAVISGSGNIYLTGNPVIDQTTTGSGRVITR